MHIAVIIGLIVAVTIVILIFKVPHVSLAPILFSHIFFAVLVRMLWGGSGAMYIMLGILVVALLVFALRNPAGLLKFSPQEVAMFLLGSLMLVSLAFTPAPIYGQNKVLRFFGWMFPLIVGARLFSSTQRDTERLLNVLSFFAAITMLFYTLLYVTLREHLMMGDRFVGLSLSWSCAMCVALSVYSIFQGSIWRKILMIASSFCGIWVMAAAGGRGAFYAVIMAGALTFLGRRGLIRSFVFLVIIVGSSHIAKTYLIEREISDRLSLLDLGGRPALWKSGAGQFISNPVLGGGAGSFAIHWWQADIPAWPHNNWLEVAGEQGIVGLACLVTALWFTASTMLKLRKAKGRLVGISKATQMLFWVAILNSCSSSDIVAQSGLFASFGIMAGVRLWLSPAMDYQATDLDFEDYPMESADGFMPSGHEAYGDLPTAY